MKLRYLVGLTGPAGVGKSAFARELVANYGFVRMAFADPLKAMLRALLQTWGYNDAACDYWIDGDGKERVCPALQGKTPRFAMQQIGTEWGRQGMGMMMWIDHLLTRLRDSPHERIVVDDIRFDNEALAILQMDGCVFGIKPLGNHIPKRHPEAHVSEDGISEELMDATVLNDFTFEGVAAQAHEIILPKLIEGSQA